MRDGGTKRLIVKGREELLTSETQWCSDSRENIKLEERNVERKRKMEQWWNEQDKRRKSERENVKREDSLLINRYGRIVGMASDLKDNKIWELLYRWRVGKIIFLKDKMDRG